MKRKIIDALDFKIRQQVSFKVKPHHPNSTPISDARISAGIFFSNGPLDLD
jgi:carbamoylphosphate synthase small subunit